jgi:hypothetical protein
VENEEKVEDELSSVSQLQITQYEVHRTFHICVMCCCDKQELAIVLSGNDWKTVQIDGVDVTVEQARELLGKLFDTSPQEEFPRFGVRNKQTGEVSYETQEETIPLWNDDKIELTDEMMDVNFGIRRIRFYELASMVATANNREYEI